MTQNNGEQNAAQSLGQLNSDSQKLDQENNTNLGKIQNDIYTLITLFERDQIEKVWLAHNTLNNCII